MLAIKQIKFSGEIVNLGRVPCSLEMAQDLVKSGADYGLIEPFHSSEDGKYTLMCHEEGLLIGLPVNIIASLASGQHIVGDVLIVENEAKDFE